MADHKQTSREKILAAASELARDTGPGHLSLDAVASRAGVSKGGLLYNFPTKAKLMQALVEEHIDKFEADLDAAANPGASGGDHLLRAYLQLSRQECCDTHPSAAGLLAAMAEDPDFLLPIKVFKRKLLDRLKGETKDVVGLLTAFLVIEGLRSLKLFDLDMLTDAERDLVFQSLLSATS